MMDPKIILRILLNSPGTKPGEWGIPGLFWGNPGIGKTAIIRGLSLELGFQAFVLSPGEMGEGAFGVVPVPLSEPGKPVRIVYPAPEWVDQIGEEGVLFVDELSSAPPQLHPPLLGLILEKRIGGIRLPKGIRIVGAANPPEVAANGFDLPPPVANRLGHFEWPAQGVDDWSGYMSRKDWSSDSDPTQSELSAIRAENKERVLRHYAVAYAKAAALVCAFITRRPELKNKMPTSGATSFASWAYPTDRSWDASVSAIAGTEANGFDSATADEMVAGFVGQACSTELAAFRASADLPDPIGVLDGIVPFSHNPSRMDRTFVTMDACASIVARTDCTNRAARAARLWAMLDGIATTSPDLALRPASTLVKAGLTNFAVGGKLVGIVQASK